MAANSSAVIPLPTTLQPSGRFWVMTNVQRVRTRHSPRGFSLIELLIVIAIILIILAIAVPKLGSARMGASEMAVIRELQTINTMQIQYMSQFGRFAVTLAELGPPPAAPPVHKPPT